MFLTQKKNLVLVKLLFKIKNNIQILIKILNKFKNKNNNNNKRKYINLVKIFNLYK